MRGNQYWEAELYRIKGELLQTRYEVDSENNLSEIEECFRHALGVARRQSAKSLELRSAMSLARLWQKQGKISDAGNLLAPIYGCFTEGFDTPDLIDAKALLEELR